MKELILTAFAVGGAAMVVWLAKVFWYRWSEPIEVVVEKMAEEIQESAFVDMTEKAIEVGEDIKGDLNDFVDSLKEEAEEIGEWPELVTERIGKGVYKVSEKAERFDDVEREKLAKFFAKQPKTIQEEVSPYRDDLEILEVFKNVIQIKERYHKSALTRARNKNG